MSHWIILPVVLPAMLAAVIILVARHHVRVQRVLSISGAIALLAIAIGLIIQADDGTVTLYQLGHWQAPFGIVLVADRLSTYMVLLTAILALLVIIHATGSGWDKRGNHFHALFHFQIMGIMGAFLTGDVFNLFVFFEVLLISSYGLIVHSGGSYRLRTGTQYVLFNLLGSTLFLFALGLIYAETGTLNMADLAQRIPLIDLDANAGIRIAAVLLLLVFAVKGALVPLHFWLPSAYSAAPAPVAALFAIMTKVGAYAIIRVYTLVFAPDLEVTADLYSVWLLPLALFSMGIGMVGALAAMRVDRMIAFSVIGSMGMVMTAIAVMTPDSITAALYYIPHSTFATAALFLIADLVIENRGKMGARLEASEPIPGAAYVAAMFFIAAIAMVGMPPLSGFIGKLLILQASIASDLVVWVWAVVLISSLIAIMAFARAGSVLFWKAKQTDDGQELDENCSEEEVARARTASELRPTKELPLLAILTLIGLLIVHTVLAGQITTYLRDTTAQLFAPDNYISTVLGTEGKTFGSHGDKAKGSDHGEDKEASPGEAHLADVESRDGAEDKGDEEDTQ
ncbi:monovalent cation/H+ antiporter subunit D [Palleronia caenipelagi]|uniref:Monovalent cation/H+ antiporter subunit D n=1 Tax=Palleronia caenipelagi TaxID=2489174 RepID=A0A547Q8C1_9RHOB|nr:monovalent cation/H+ antiporter subunit D [Palleronia caenipelagi]TRD22626.1 monovalent cation/H+ antiporter subunit D [Palleronia caenipelagi]